MQKEDSQAKLAVSERETGKIHIYDVRSGSDDALHSFEVHRTPVVAMRYNAAHDSVVSVDQRGTAIFTRSHDLALAYTAHSARSAVVPSQPRVMTCSAYRDDRILVCKGIRIPRGGCGLQHEDGHRPLCPAEGQGASAVP